jgi:serine/threonine protein kinase
MARLKRFWFGSDEVRLPSDYYPNEPIGQGAYGMVFSAKNVRTGEKVAIKKFKLSGDKPLLAKSALREIMLLARLNHPNIVRIVSLYPSSASMKEIYMTLELMDTDLASVIASKQALSLTQVRHLFYQLIASLAYLHSVGIMHRDIKPRNLLVNANCHLKLGDFGLARTATCSKTLTEYVCTRWYRAPEILFKLPSYDFKIDVFSAGCVLAELVRRKPLLPGLNALEQIALLLRRLGVEELEDVSWISGSEFQHFITNTSVGLTRRGDLDEFMKSEEMSFCLEPISGIIREMCAMNPCKRPSAKDVLQYDWLGVARTKNLAPAEETNLKIPSFSSLKSEYFSQAIRNEMTLVAIINDRL